jgi:hypothetical protein
VEKESILGRSQDSEFRIQNAGAGSGSRKAWRRSSGVAGGKNQPVPCLEDGIPEAEEPLSHSVTPELLYSVPVISPR